MWLSAGEEWQKEAQVEEQTWFLQNANPRGKATAYNDTPKGAIKCELLSPGAEPWS